LVVAQRVLDFIGHRELGEAQHARLPKLGHAGTQGGLDLLPFIVVGRVEPRDQIGHGALGVQDRLALHFGRVGGQHRREVSALEQGGDVVGAHAFVAQALEAGRERAWRGHLGGVLALAHLVAVFGQVGQVREIAEGADHRHALVGRQVLEQAVEVLAGHVVTPGPVGHGQLADFLDQLISLSSILLPDHVAQDPAQQADVAQERRIAFGGGGFCGDGRMGALARGCLGDHAVLD